MANSTKPLSSPNMSSPGGVSTPNSTTPPSSNTPLSSNTPSASNTPTPFRRATPARQKIRSLLDEFEFYETGQVKSVKSSASSVLSENGNETGKGNAHEKSQEGSVGNSNRVSGDEEVVGVVKGDDKTGDNNDRKSQIEHVTEALSKTGLGEHGQTETEKLKPSVSAGSEIPAVLEVPVINTDCSKIEEPKIGEIKTKNDTIEPKIDNDTTKVAVDTPKAAVNTEESKTKSTEAGSSPNSKSSDEAIAAYLEKLEIYHDLKAKAAESFAKGFLEFGLANSRSRSSLDKYAIDERVTDPDVTVSVVNGSKMELCWVDDVKKSAHAESKEDLKEPKAESEESKAEPKEHENGSKEEPKTTPHSQQPASSTKAIISSGGFSSGYAQSLVAAQREFRVAVEMIVEAYQAGLKVKECEKLL